MQVNALYGDKRYKTVHLYANFDDFDPFFFKPREIQEKLLYFSHFKC